MQHEGEVYQVPIVVFTLQTAGRCNNSDGILSIVSVVFTLQTAGRCNLPLYIIRAGKLFLPCKQQADATHLT